MYIWFLDYGYLAGVIIFFLLTPFAAFIINKKRFNKESIFQIFFLNLLIFSIVAISLLYLKSLHIYTIENICFDYPVMTYKDSNIPKECYSFDKNKYSGIGWTLKGIFWIVLQSFYFLFIYVIKKKK